MNILEELLGDGTEHGEETSYNCPFCVQTGRSPDNEEKMWVNASKGMFICYRCETAGSIKYLLRRLGAPEEETVVIASDLAKRVRKLQGLDVDDVVEEIEEPVVVNYLEEIINNGCVPIAVGSAAWHYLRNRNIFDEEIAHYRIIEGRGRYRSRVIVPTFNEDGKLAYFVARAYKPLTMRAKDGTRKEAPKYLNPKGEGRKRSVFNLAKAKDHESIIITEGVFSAIAAGPNAVATFGKLVTDTQLGLLIEAGREKELVVCLDGDAHEEAVDVAQRLAERHDRVTLVMLPVGHDPDSLGREEFRNYFLNRLPYSTLNVAKMQALGLMRKRKPPVANKSISSLDSLRSRLLRSG